MRPGAEYFLTPAGASQRRYEALRAYFVDDMPAAEVADRFGYSTASVHQMATLLRTGKLSLFAETRPGPKGPRKATGELRARVLALRAAGHSRHRDRRRAHRRGHCRCRRRPCWQILDAEGTAPAAPPRRGPPRPAGPAGAGQGRRAARLASGRRRRCGCDHAGLLLLFPAMADARPARPGPRGRLPLHPGAVTAWQSIGTLLLAKCARKARVHHVGSLTDDEGLAFTLGLTALPKATHLGTYSWRVRRESNQQTADRPGRGAAPARAGHRRGRVQLRLPRHPPPRRRTPSWKSTTCPAAPSAPAPCSPSSPRTTPRTEMVYANADITKAEQAAEIIAFADYWQQGHRIETPACWSSTPS